MCFSDYLNEIKKISDDMKKSEPDMQFLIKTLKDCKESGNRIFIIGNGGSASTATHMACDLFKTAHINAKSFDNIPLNSAITNDEGWSELFKYQLERENLKPFDMVIAISVHGGSGEEKAGPWSQNLNKAIDYANDKGATTIGFSGFDGGYLKEHCDRCFVIPAESTPIVEAFHVVLHHYIAFALQEGDRK